MIYSLLTKPVKTNGETDEKSEPSESVETDTKEESKTTPTPFNLANIKSDAISPLLKLAVAQQQQAQSAQTNENENKSNPFDTIKSFGLERFSGKNLPSPFISKSYLNRNIGCNEIN